MMYLTQISTVIKKLTHEPNYNVKASKGPAMVENNICVRLRIGKYKACSENCFQLRSHFYSPTGIACCDLK